MTQLPPSVSFNMIQFGSANSGMLHATFPTKGEYRLWFQFNDDNQLKTIPVSVNVE
ncbi:hypothetical protein K2X05_00670 [bacterium]|nr:hypothetical protein [bacterium]